MSSEPRRSGPGTGEWSTSTAARASSEAALALQLAQAGVQEEDVAKCHSFAAEERQHGVLCGAVVEALGGEAHAEIAEPDIYPPHADAAPLEAALRNPISISCLSETVAVALIGAERMEMPDGELHTLLTRIYADECGHCNFGWRLLSDLLPREPGLADRLARYLPAPLPTKNSTSKPPARRRALSRSRCQPGPM